ncbi:hypothetical protein [Alkalicoccobacillus porphyridii]|uniref:Uncharacterized protein n=1 Tax=Alkalicoccobacillus porphyridii TaxID=2597270 RepID=A0A553ZTV9_9BACI|nr:hypothetical protein [Alkalicoccobacillus porphyridii]TSB44909.1 hypothetical protein FN960_18850 [Alkalicoccobacillus porphyridii]
MTHQLFDYLDKEQERLKTKKSPVEEKEYQFFEEVITLYEKIDNALQPAVEKGQLTISETSIGANRFNLMGKLIKVYGKKPVVLIPDVTASQRGDYKISIQSGATVLHSTYFFFDNGKWKSNRHEFGGMKKSELNEQAFMDILLLLIR